ncbi:uroporphyrinogen decarboxylase [Desertifilum sp. FACHB-1129]|uniref:Uroporphyrinogen decarboxylase n=1 Tax=Desertifilum tharense IPPAS B-1220 TaxID=1781255 RepID=A0A1E5QF39_9CYAN|nr:MULTISPECIES: uroporphyrinogen decarboxylase [Desertifilum]MDA0213593.1 uroporphyrinogen decarboxylase [Cyanobacteria bacterium FC1]MBD2314947.1 uroporphyrinogen decarboxylase [Desertifilum sp. FACHB-1129]MBD2325053.1 uroporphyrinogen decarboxylase [Desertifilum sp. FACHB-866]MBD2335227.1 uroporphyrinogen decarboxylase [Desertifilum sp. FACHB-868]OEJ73295.1 uroporphyrinogen decarboxylase [Desertifilum tharense IPPAS B-1220]
MTESTQIPYLLRATRGETLSRPPVWMMRQAGRYMQVYRDLSEKYPSFRERSETPELAIEISLQPYRAFQPDGVIMFSDILTPLPGVGIPFDIVESKGPIIDPPIRSLEQIQQLRPLEPEASLPFIKTILQTLRQEVGNNAAVLGFVGAPWTLAAYAIEGRTSKSYSNIKRMAFTEPAMLHQLLSHLASAIATYVCYQIDCGAQVVQMFDSWAGQLSPQDYAAFALPYQQQVVKQVKATHPDTPLILYISGSAGVFDLMAQSGVDMISVDWTVDMADARNRLDSHIGVQGNVDPGVLFGSKETIRARILDTIRKAGNKRHILNLGHGILPGTPEESAACFFETAKQADQLLAGCP